MLYVLLQVAKKWLVESGLYSVLQVFDQLEFRALMAAALSFLLVLLLGRRTIAYLTRLKIGDSGLTDADALRATASAKANVPTMGGVLIVGAIAMSTVLLSDIRQTIVQLGLVVVLWLAALGGVDDWLKLTSKRRGGGSRQGLYAWEKLVFQLGLGVLVGYFLFVQPARDDVPKGEDLRHVLNLPFQKTWVKVDSVSPVLPKEADGKPAPIGVPEPAMRVVTGEVPRIVNPNVIILSLPVFIVIATLMVAGMSNAVNITDGMDGLAGGVSAAVVMGLFVLCFIAGDSDTAKYLLVPWVPGAGELSVLAGATAGACLGFLWWNCSPAQVFMGDTGALALGGVIGYIAVALRQEVVVLLMSGVFLLEIATVVLQVGYFKLTGGKRLFRVAPYHHHLHVLGWPEQRVVARLWIMSIILIVMALASIKLR